MKTIQKKHLQVKKQHAITSLGKKLSITVFYPDTVQEKLPAIILGAGWMNSLENNYEFAEDVSKGVSAIVVVFDYLGVGSSDGDIHSYSRKDHLQNILDVFDFVTGLPEVDAERIGLNGGSYSGYLAVLVIAQRKVKSLLLRAPAVFPDDTIDVVDDTSRDRPDRYFQKNANEKIANSIAENMKGYSNPVLVQERESDTLITKEVVEFFTKNSASSNMKHTVLKNAGHKISGEQKQKSTQECIDWFKTTV